MNTDCEQSLQEIINVLSSPLEEMYKKVNDSLASVLLPSLLQSLS